MTPAEEHPQPGGGYVPIWFFIGALLFAYGLLILGTGIHNLLVPPQRPVAMSGLHADVWWGILLLVLGGFYAFRFFPRRDAGAERGADGARE
jgi:hypothetical protein